MTSTFFVDARFIDGVDPEPHMEDEKRQVQHLRDAGIFQQVLVRKDGTGAYLVAVARDVDELQRHLGTLPFVQHTVMTMRIDEVGEAGNLT